MTTAVTSLPCHFMGGDAIVFAARRLGDRVAGPVWVDAFRSLGNEPVNSSEQVEDFLAPFRKDFPGAVDQFVRNLFPAGADGDLVDRVAADTAAVRRDATLGSLGYALNREPAIITALADVTAPIVAITRHRPPTPSRCVGTASSRSCSGTSVNSS